MEGARGVVLFRKEVTEPEENVFVEILRRVLIESHTHLDHELVQEPRVSLHSHNFVKPVGYFPELRSVFLLEKVVQDLPASVKVFNPTLLVFLLLAGTLGEQSGMHLHPGKIEEGLDEQILLLLRKLLFLLKHFGLFETLLELLI